MIVSESNVHHWPNDHLTVPDDWSLKYTMHTKDSRLRGIDDWCSKQWSKHTTIAKLCKKGLKDFNVIWCFLGGYFFLSPRSLEIRHPTPMTMEIRSLSSLFVWWRQVNLNKMSCFFDWDKLEIFISKLSCLHHPKSDDGDLISIDTGDKVSSDIGDKKKLPIF